MKRTLFLDRDGTLVEPRHYPSKPADLVLSAGIGPVLRTFQVAGWELIVVTNQSDLARGYFTEGDLTRMHDAITDEVITLPEELQHSHTTVLVSDSKTIGRFANCPSTLATPNQQEAWRAVDPDVAPAQPVDLELAHVLGRKLRGMLRTSTIAVTVADRGVLLTGPDSGQSHVPCQPTACASDVGAGDTFIAAAAMAPAAGAPAEQAVRIGIDAASIAITRGRTSTVSAQDLLRRFSLADATPVRSLKEVVAQLEIDRFHGTRMVFTNGVFDILHAGHVNLLRREGPGRCPGGWHQHLPGPLPGRATSAPPLDRRQRY